MAFACQAVLPDLAGASAEAKSRAAQTVFEIIAAAESEVARSQFIGERLRTCGCPSPRRKKDFQGYLARLGRQAAARPAAVLPPDSAPVSANSPQSPEHHLLLLWLHFELLHRPLSTALHHEWVDTGHLSGLLLNRFIGEFEQGAWPGRDHLEALLENDAERAPRCDLVVRISRPR